jgi:hypothetical protein
MLMLEKSRGSLSVYRRVSVEGKRTDTEREICPSSRYHDKYPTHALRFLAKRR